MKDPSLASGQMCQVISTYTSVCGYVEGGRKIFVAHGTTHFSVILWGSFALYGTIAFVAKKRALPLFI